MINQYDKDVRPHGLWEYYYDNGQLHHRGEYKNGKMHGLWESYWYNGQIEGKGELKNDRERGFWYESQFDK